MYIKTAIILVSGSVGDSIKYQYYIELNKLSGNTYCFIFIFINGFLQLNLYFIDFEDSK